MNFYIAHFIFMANKFDLKCMQTAHISTLNFISFMGH